MSLNLRDALPKDKSILLYGNRLAESETLEALMRTFQLQLREVRYLPMSGRIVDATLIPEPQQCNAEDEKAAIEARTSARQICYGKMSKPYQQDVNARLIVMFGGESPLASRWHAATANCHARVRYKSHISTGGHLGFIGDATVISVSDSDGRQLRQVTDVNNTVGDNWPPAPLVPGTTRHCCSAT